LAGGIPCVTPPDKRDTGLTHPFLINTTPWIPFYDTFVVFPAWKKHGIKINRNENQGNFNRDYSQSRLEEQKYL
jgi:hypothetical protein